MNAVLERASTVDATLSFDSPVLLSDAAASFNVQSKIDVLLGRTKNLNATQNVLFSLPVFDPNRLFVHSLSQKVLYSIGGPRIVTFFVKYLTVVPVSVTLNSINCPIIKSPSLADIRSQPSGQFAITIVVDDFPATFIGDITAFIFSGMEQADATLTVIAQPTNPVLVAQQGNDAIPSTSSLEACALRQCRGIFILDDINDFVLYGSHFWQTPS